MKHVAVAEACSELKKNITHRKPRSTITSLWCARTVRNLQSLRKHFMEAKLDKAGANDRLLCPSVIEMLDTFLGASDEFMKGTGITEEVQAKIASLSKASIRSSHQKKVKGTPPSEKPVEGIKD